MSIRKRFDPKLYEENDKIAKDFVKNLLKGTEYQVIENSKKRGVDMLLYKDSQHIANIECERKIVWVNQEFPYENVQIPERKTKYAVLEEPTVFVMLNKDQTAYLAIPQQNLLSSPIKEIPNKYNFKGEMFYQFPKEQVYFNDLLSAIKEIIK